MDETPQEITVRIASAIVRHRKAARLTQQVVTDRICETLVLSRSTYASIEALSARPRAPGEGTVRLNRMLLDTVAQALGVPRTTLAGDEDYNALPPLPSLVRQRTPRNKTKANNYVANHKVVAARIIAFGQQKGRDYRYISEHITYLRRNSTRPAVTHKQMHHLLSDRSHLIDHDLLDDLAAVFTTEKDKPFNRDRFLQCDADPSVLCPHCHSWTTGVSQLRHVKNNTIRLNKGLE